MLDFTPAIDKIRSMLEGFVARIPNMIVAIMVLVAFYILANLARKLVHRLTAQAKLQADAGEVLGRLARWGTLLLGMLVAFPILFDDFGPGQVLEVLGIAGVAIGFAFRDILQNFLAGIMLLVTQTFVIGDQIIVGPYEGTIEEIDTRATLLKTYDGRRIVIPNASLVTESVMVNTAFPKRRSEYDLGIGYGDDVDLARRVMLDTMQSVPEVNADPAPEVLVVELAGSSVNLRARWWTNSRRSDVVRVRDRVIEAIKAALARNGIDMPFPTQQVLFHDQTEETDGDRRRQREGWPVAPDVEPPQPRRIVDALDALGLRKE